MKDRGKHGSHTVNAVRKSAVLQWIQCCVQAVQFCNSSVNNNRVSLAFWITKIYQPIKDSCGEDTAIFSMQGNFNLLVNTDKCTLRKKKGGKTGGVEMKRIHRKGDHFPLQTCVYVEHLSDSFFYTFLCHSAWCVFHYVKKSPFTSGSPPYTYCDICKLFISYWFMQQEQFSWTLLSWSSFRNCSVLTTELVEHT